MTLAYCLMPELDFEYLINEDTLQQHITDILSGQNPDPNHNITRDVAYVLNDMLHTDPIKRLTIDQLSKKLWLTRGVSKRTLPPKNEKGRYHWFPSKDSKRRRGNWNDIHWHTMIYSRPLLYRKNSADQSANWYDWIYFTHLPIRSRLGLDNQASHFRSLVTALTTLDIWSIK